MVKKLLTKLLRRVGSQMAMQSRTSRCPAAVKTVVKSIKNVLQL